MHRRRETSSVTALVCCEASCHLFHRLDLAAHRSATPRIKTLARPSRILVRRKSLKVLFHQVAAHTLQVVLQQFAELYRLLFAQVLRSLQQQPAAPYE